MRVVYHVTCDKLATPSKRWRVRKRGRTISAHRKQGTAIRAAKVLAKRARLGQVVFHGRDGKIRGEYTYGRDPRATPN